MNRLLAAAWLLFALDLIMLALMASEVLAGNVSEAEWDYAVAATWVLTVWLCLVSAILIAGWWQQRRAGLWVAVGTAALPLLWAWTVVVSALSG